MPTQIPLAITKPDICNPKCWIYSNLFLIATLIAINLICFGRTLNGYFLADDFIHIPYLARVFQGHPELLLQNFYTNWMQTAGTQFYRPLISITLAGDYLFWQANAMGYHITNTFFQILNSIFLFLAARRILQEYGKSRSTIVAFFAAALFAANPLHTEVVSWIIGRVDSVCSAFLLGSFWLFLKGIQDSSNKSSIASAFLFVLSLLSKEMAVTLPPALTVYLLFSQNNEKSWNAKIKNSLRMTWIFWAILLGYFGIRTLSLGTISGGYTGSIGEGLSTSFFKRWFQDQSIMRVFFPFNAEVFSPHHSLRKLLHLIYILSGISILSRLSLKLIFKDMPAGFTKYILFALIWFLVSMAPTYQVFNITETLQSSRFIYLGTAPLCFLLALLIFPLYSDNLNHLRIQKIFRYLAVALLSLLVICYTAITYKNNLPWAHAGAQVRSLRINLESTLKELSANRTLVLMNLPQRLEGAHMLYNAAMLSILLSPPLSAQGIASRVATFEPITYGDSNLLNVSRLRRLAEQPENYSFYKWDGNTKKLIKLNLNNKLQGLLLCMSKNIRIDEKQSPEFLYSPQLDLNPLGIDFVEITIAGTSVLKSNSRYLCLYWLSPNSTFPTTENSLCKPLILDGQPHTYTFAVSQYKSWSLSEKIDQVALQLPPGNYKLSNISFSNGAKRIPLLAGDPKTVKEELDGISYLIGTYGDFNYDASKIPGAASIAIEISKPNAWFEHYSGELRDTSLSKSSLVTKYIQNTQGQFRLNASDLPTDAYYQIRLAALNSNEQMIGYISDPINIQVSAAQIISGKQLIKQLMHKK